MGVTALVLNEMRQSVTMYFRVPKIISTFKNKRSYFFGVLFKFILYFYYMYFISSWNQTGLLHLKWIAFDVTASSDTSGHGH